MSWVIALGPRHADGTAHVCCVANKIPHDVAVALVVQLIRSREEQAGNDSRYEDEYA